MKRLFAVMFVLCALLCALGCTNRVEKETQPSSETAQTLTMFPTEFRTMTAPPPQSRTPEEKRILDLIASNAVDWMLNGTNLDLVKDLNLVPDTSEGASRDAYYVKTMPNVQIDIRPNSGEIRKIEAPAEILLPQFLGVPVEKFSSVIGVYTAVYLPPEFEKLSYHILVGFEHEREGAYYWPEGETLKPYHIVQLWHKDRYPPQLPSPR